MKLSVVSATFNRADLLDRSLATYARQALPRDVWEYLVVDDGSTDQAEAVVERWRRQSLPVCLLHADRIGRPKVPGVWRDGRAASNVGVAGT